LAQPQCGNDHGDPLKGQFGYSLGYGHLEILLSKLAGGARGSG
jgi:hypothetical protein